MMLNMAANVNRIKIKNGKTIKNGKRYEDSTVKQIWELVLRVGNPLVHKVLAANIEGPDVGMTHDSLI